MTAPVGKRGSVQAAPKIFRAHGGFGPSWLEIAVGDQQDGTLQTESIPVEPDGRFLLLHRTAGFTGKEKKFYQTDLHPESRTNVEHRYLTPISHGSSYCGS